MQRPADVYFLFVRYSSSLRHSKCRPTLASSANKTHPKGQTRHLRGRCGGLAALQTGLVRSRRSPQSLPSSPRTRRASWLAASCWWTGSTPAGDSRHRKQQFFDSPPVISTGLSRSTRITALSHCDIGSGIASWRRPGWAHCSTCGWLGNCSAGAES